MRRSLPVVGLVAALTAFLPLAGCLSSQEPTGEPSPVTGATAQNTPAGAEGREATTATVADATVADRPRPSADAARDYAKREAPAAPPPAPRASTRVVLGNTGAVGVGKGVGRGSGNSSSRGVASGAAGLGVVAKSVAGGGAAYAPERRMRMLSQRKAPRGQAVQGLLGVKGSTSKVADRKVRGPVAPDPVFAEQDKGGRFEHAGTNPFVETKQDKLSTFSIDVDTASYTYARRFLQQGNRPNASSVRVEEWVNAFHYDYDAPTGKHPFSIAMQAGPSPMAKGKHVLRVGIQGKKVDSAARKPVHLTFLVDTSGSMRRHDKLPLAQRALHLLVNQLDARDSVALITYAGSTQQVLGQTRVDAEHLSEIHRAINGLMAGGGTAMGSGMEMAYRNAGKFVAPGSVSRVIVLSDGDANIGRTSHQAILKSIKGYVSEGITMSTVGFGTGNYQDHLMEQLADAGDGNYSYIDSMAGARKVFGTDLSGTLEVIAKDVKIQVEMNPKVVKRYRLLGYENRDIADRDFRNDKVDAGEIGAGHSVTALYEVELVDPRAEVKDDVATVRVRYKKPRGTKATEVAEVFTQNHVRTRFGDLDVDTRWAAAVSLAAEVLRGSPYAADKTLEDAWALAAEAASGKYAKERRELVDLLSKTHQQGSVAIR